MDLTFTIKNQTIKRTDNSEPVQLSKNYLNAKFEFETPDWDGLVKTAIFLVGERAYNVVLENDSCKVPYDATKKAGNIFVSVFAGDLITANSAQVFIGNSGYQEGTAPVDPEPTVYEQLTSAIGDIEADVTELQEDMNEVKPDVTQLKLDVEMLMASKLPACPTDTDGDFHLVANVNSGVATYSWAAYTP